MNDPEKKPRVDVHMVAQSASNRWLFTVWDWEWTGAEWKTVRRTAPSVDGFLPPSRAKRAEVLRSAGWQLEDDGPDAWEWYEVTQAPDADPLIYAMAKLVPAGD